MTVSHNIEKMCNNPPRTLLRGCLKYSVTSYKAVTREQG